MGPGTLKPAIQVVLYVLTRSELIEIHFFSVHRPTFLM